MGDKPLILQIDDSNFVLTFTKTILKQLGCEFLPAKSAMEGLKLASEKKPALILLDATMPDMDGYQTLETLRKNLATKDIPVIMVTGLDNPSEIERATAAGANSYLIKPFKLEGLREKLSAYVKLPRSA